MHELHMWIVFCQLHVITYFIWVSGNLIYSNVFLSFLFPFNLLRENPTFGAFLNNCWLYFFKWDMIVNDKLLTEDLCNLSVFANVGAHWAAALQVKTLNKTQWTFTMAVKKSNSGCPFSLCDSCSALLFLFSGTIVILHDFTARYCLALWSNLLLVSFFSFSIKKKKIKTKKKGNCITGVSHCVELLLVTV